MRPVQYFSDNYLKQTHKLSPEEVLEFLDNFRLMSEKPVRSRLISMKVQEPLLAAFRLKCSERGVRYQTQIKELMADWLRGR